MNAPIPANSLNHSHSMEPGQIACVSARLCAAVGTYIDRSGREHPLLLSGAGRKWTAGELPLPRGPFQFRYGELTWLACPHSCDAAGMYGTEFAYLSSGPL